MLEKEEEEEEEEEAFLIRSSQISLNISMFAYFWAFLRDQMPCDLHNSINICQCFPLRLSSSSVALKAKIKTQNESPTAIVAKQWQRSFVFRKQHMDMDQHVQRHSQMVLLLNIAIFLWIKL